MLCPSCEKQMPDAGKFCGRCGLFLNKTSGKLLQLSINTGWIIRRSMGGFAAGAIGWVLAMAVVRTVGLNSGPGFHSFLLCVITGTFLGTVGGIIEDSGYKAFLGGLLGCVGGALGGILGKILSVMFGGGPLTSVSFIPSWIVMGGVIGAVSGIVEKSGKKITIGVLIGMFGGGIGGFMGVEAYGSLVTDFMKEGSTWITGRSVEAFAGGTFGAAFWLVLGIIEKLFIFKRRWEGKIEQKTCDTCKTQNPLTYWYCIKCGAALQVAAPREKIKVTSFRSLERSINAFKFLSWLFGATGIITTIFVFIIVLFQNPLKNFMFAILTGLSIGLTSYLLVVIFGFIANMLSSVVKITDSLEMNKGNPNLPPRS